MASASRCSVFSTTAYKRWPSRVAEAARVGPAVSVWPIFTPSAPSYLKGVRIGESEKPEATRAYARGGDDLCERGERHAVAGQDGQVVGGGDLGRGAQPCGFAKGTSRTEPADECVHLDHEAPALGGEARLMGTHGFGGLRRLAACRARRCRQDLATLLGIQDIGGERVLGPPGRCLGWRSAARLSSWASDAVSSPRAEAGRRAAGPRRAVA
jgi:hypothetical protein